MKVWPEDLIEYDHTYKMELAFPEMSKIAGVALYFKTLTLLDNYDIGASWTYTKDSWILTYHLKASGRSLTHGQMFDNCIKSAYEGAIWIDCIDLGERESLFEPETPLPEVISKNWKWLIGIVITVLVLLVILPYGYKTGRS